MIWASGNNSFMLPFNRTIVELKLSALVWSLAMVTTFNRTIVELKQGVIL